MMDFYGYPNLGRFGRLGNMLWEVSATVAAARRYGGVPRVPIGWEYRPFLSLPESFYGEPQTQDVDVARLPNGPYHQSLDCIAEVAGSLDLWFYPSEKARLLLDKTYPEILERMQSEHFTAAHVRRTDYLQHPTKFPSLTPAFYLEALARVYEQHPSTTLLVFSDDPLWCRQHAEAYGFGKAIFIAGHVRPVEVAERTGEPLDILDLFLMARCSSFVVANSSFSWWGAFLSGSKEVFYPDRWFGPTADNYSTMWDCIPEGWTQIPC